MSKTLTGLPFLMCKTGANVVGGYAKFLLGKRKRVNDIDLIVPPEKWWVVSLLIPKTAWLNKHGGLRFDDEDSGFQVDIWPCSIEQHLRQCSRERIECVVDYMNQKVFTSQNIRTR